MRAAPWKFVALWLGILATAPSSAITLAFVPVGQVVPLGQPALVDVHVLDTVDSLPPSVGGYDITVAFDASILGDTDFAFDALLGSPLSVTAVDVSIPGLINFVEVSLLDPGDLDALQPDAFPLGRLSFGTIGIGTSPLTFAGALVSDVFGLGLPAVTTTGSITVIALPGSLPLLACALVAWLATQRRYARMRFISGSYSGLSEAIAGTSRPATSTSKRPASR
jgi:hypothetical protein